MTNKTTPRSRSFGASDPSAELGLRDLRYLESYGCYPCRTTIELEIHPPGILEALSFRVLNLIFDSVQGIQALRDVPPKSWEIDFKGQRQFTLSFDLDPGYYLLLAAHQSQSSAVPFVVADYEKPADVAVIRPVFTQWSYHSDGFYFNDYRSPFDRALSHVGQSGGLGRLTERASRELARRLGLHGINFPYRPFPAHSTINLGGFYRRNNRWERTIWDARWGRQEGLWVDEVLSGMPIFALLNKNAISYHVFTDVDFHNQNAALASYRVLIFSGQEGVTNSYYQMLQRLQSAGETSFLLWGTQAFGYRQFAYDAATGELRYLCTRGHRGMWGDELNDRQPDWKDEGRLFGFHFPEPQSPNWRYDKPYSQIIVSQIDHPIVSQFGGPEKTFHYEVQDSNGERHPGLTWAGGEIQRRVTDEARVIAYLDDDPEVIGIGEYRNTVVFAPTYLPAFFAYQSLNHPEVEAWFMGALNYLMGTEE